MVEFVTPEILDYILKIVLSIVLGGLIGIEREISHHWAGFRTHILVCLGATLFMFVTVFETLSLPAGVNLSLDATRIAAGVVTGIGFLGAGVIFKEGASVKGLTTAATIWVTAAVGLLVGIGNYVLAIVSTLLIIVVLFSDNLIEEKFFKSSEVMYLRITFMNKENEEQRLERIIEKMTTKYFLNSFTKNSVQVSIKYKLIIRKANREPLTRLLLKDAKVVSVKWTE